MNNYIKDDCGNQFEILNPNGVELFGLIPQGLSIWNAGIIDNSDGSAYVKLYVDNKCNGYSVDPESLKVIRVSKSLAAIIDACCSVGGRNPKENKKALKSKNPYERLRAESIKPIINYLFGIDE